MNIPTVEDKCMHVLLETLTKAAASAVGIPDRKVYGNHLDLKKGDIVDYVAQQHLADRAGEHIDFRIGNKDLGLFSWAVRNGMPEEGVPTMGVRQPLHTHEYKDFQGTIESGYGKGLVKKLESGKMLVTDIADNKILLSKADKQQPERLNLIHTGEGNWILNVSRHPEKPDVKKPEFKLLDSKNLETFLNRLEEGDEVQPKVDGASSIIQLKNNRLEMFSHRISKKNNKAIVQTEKVLGNRSKLDLPKEYNGLHLLGEIYGVKDGKYIPAQEVSGLLNSSIANSLQSQKESKVHLKTMLFDIVSNEPYSQRRAKLQEIAKHLSADKFHVVESATSPDKIKELFKTLKAKSHPLTEEGFIVRKKNGEAYKGKFADESNVYISGFTKADPGTKYENSHIGAIEYSLTPGGRTVGKIGTGINDSLRKLFYEDPKRFIGRKISVNSLGQYPSGAYRMPVLNPFHNLEES